MTLFNKIKWVLGIVLIFLLVLTTNLVDRQNFMVVKESMDAIYADRLVAQDIIFDLSKLIWEKEIAYLKADDSDPITDDRREIAEDIRRFAETKLTRQEEDIFERLRLSVEELLEEEVTDKGGERTAVLAAIENVKNDLNDLSQIQMKEGRRQLFAGKKAISSADLFTQLEIAVLIVLAIAVQIIILYSPRPETEEEEEQ